VAFVPDDAVLQDGADDDDEQLQGDRDALDRVPPVESVEIVTAEVDFYEAISTVICG
jgi:hypothetical protein